MLAIASTPTLSWRSNYDIWCDAKFSHHFLLGLGAVVVAWFILRKPEKEPNSKSAALETTLPQLETVPVDVNQLEQISQDDANQQLLRWRPDAIMVLDQNLKIIWANRTAENWFGILLAQDYQKDLSQRLPEPISGYLETGKFDQMLDCSAPNRQESDDSSTCDAITGESVFYSRHEISVKSKHWNWYDETSFPMLPMSYAHQLAFCMAISI